MPLEFSDRAIVRRPESVGRRAGGAYVLVVGISFLLTLMGLTVLGVAQLSVRSGTAVRDAAEADVLAQSAAELALQRTVINSSWRTAYTSGVEVSAGTMGRGTMSFRLVDELDGDLSNDPGNAVRIYGIGRVGKTTRVYSGSHGATQPLNSLLYSLASGGNINLGTVTTPGAANLSTNGSVTAGVAILNGTNLDAAGSISVLLAVGTGARRGGQNVKNLPTPASAFTWYIANGTSIGASAIPNSNGAKYIKYRLFSPNSNPYGGSVNANGIYVVDLAGQDVQISYTRVLGTLVLLNAGSGSLIQNSVYFAPATANYPSLMVQGTMAIKNTATALADNSATGDSSSPSINYNAVGSPYNGATDATYTTTYPSEIDGICYISGDLTTANAPTFNGVVLVGGAFSPGGTTTLNYTANAYNSPPPGFIGPLLVPISGTWQRELGP